MIKLISSLEYPKISTSNIQTHNRGTRICNTTLKKSKSWSISGYYDKVDMCAATSIPTFPPTFPRKITAEPVATVSCGKMESTS